MACMTPGGLCAIQSLGIFKFIQSMKSMCKHINTCDIIHECEWAFMWKSTSSDGMYSTILVKAMC